MPVYRSGIAFLLRVSENERLPYVVISEPQGIEKEVYMVRFEPLPPEGEEQQACIFEPGTIPGTDVASVVGRVRAPISCKALVRLQGKEFERLEQPVAEGVMAKIYQCLKNSDKVSSKVLNVLIEQGKIEAE